MKIFKLPDLGEGLPEAEIREWYVAEGDEVKLEQPLAAMETAKAVVDVPSPYAGRITKLYGKPGDIIKTGAPLVAFDNSATGHHDDDHDAHKDTGTVVGNLTSGSQVLEESPTGINVTRSSGGIKASPAVRSLAKSLNIDLAKITGTGPGGSITIADVQQAAGTGTAPSATIPDAERLSSVRRAMVQSMTQSHQVVVPVTLMDRADINHWGKDVDFTVRVIQAIIAACTAEPAVNAHFDGNQLAKRVYKEINLGLAVDTPAGLYVPVIKDVANRSPNEIRAHIDQFKEHAKKQNFPPHEFQGATITLSNYGSIAGRYANPIVVPPTVAIVGIGKSSEEVVAVAGRPEIHRILPLAITIDHRAVTGGEAARFLAALIKALEA